MPLTIGLIGGSGLLKSNLAALKNLKEEVVETAHGRVFLRTGSLSDGNSLVFIQRHDASPLRVYAQPADINYAAIGLALKAKNCDVVVAICSVGSLKANIGVGSIVVCDDFWCPADLRRVYADYRAHFMPTFDEPLRQAILDIIRGANFHPLPHGVYGNARGPRFETKAEIKMMASFCDIVGMTAAHEVSACCELGLPYANICMVDNYANGIGQESLTLEKFHEAQAQNMTMVENMLTSILSGLSSHPTYLDYKPKSSPAPPTGDHTVVDVDLIVNARWLMPLAAGREEEVLDHHSVVVSKGKIVDILPTASASLHYRAARTHSVSDHVVMPGLVNAHTHLCMSLMKGIADDHALLDWLNNYIWPTEGKLVDEQFVRDGAELALAELIRGGVTCVNDMYWFPGATADALQSAGVRGLVSMLLIMFPSRYAQTPDEYIERGHRERDEYMKMLQTKGLEDDSPLVRFSYAPHAPYTVSDEYLQRVHALAERDAARVHYHLHETQAEVNSSSTLNGEFGQHMSSNAVTPLQNADSLGLLNERLMAIHMTALTPQDIDIVAARNVSVVHCPVSNMKLASGFCPVDALLQRGVNVALGTDGSSSNNSLDLWGEMKTASILAKAVAGDATALPAWQALRMATLNGAKALGLDAEIGSLEIGKSADFISVRLDGIDQTPIYNVQSHLVYAGNRELVRDVWVKGVQLMEDKKLLTINEEKVKTVAQEWAKKAAENVHDRNVTIDKKFSAKLCRCMH